MSKRKSNGSVREEEEIDDNEKASTSKTSIKRIKNDKSSNLPLGKALASTEKSIRDEAVKSLRNYVSQTNVEPLNDEEMSKLWKGLFYCFWMSDKTVVQHELANELAEITLVIEKSNRKKSGKNDFNSFERAFQYLEGFFDTMYREWWGIDKWRIDKFLMIVRKFLNVSFKLLEEFHWNSKYLMLFNSMLVKERGMLNVNNNKTPIGLTYHICEIYLEEMEKVIKANEKDLIPIKEILKPFIETAAKSNLKIHYDRIFENVVEPVLQDCLQRQKELNEDNNNSDTNSKCNYPRIVNQSPETIRKDIYNLLFEIASGSNINESGRRKFYKMFKLEQDRLEDEE